MWNSYIKQVMHDFILRTHFIFLGLHLGLLRFVSRDNISKTTLNKTNADTESKQDVLITLLIKNIHISSEACKSLQTLCNQSEQQELNYNVLIGIYNTGAKYLDCMHTRTSY